MRKFAPTKKKTLRVKKTSKRSEFSLSVVSRTEIKNRARFKLVVSGISFFATLEPPHKTTREILSLSGS